MKIPVTSRKNAAELIIPELEVLNGLSDYGCNFEYRNFRNTIRYP